MQKFIIFLGTCLCLYSCKKESATTPVVTVTNKTKDSCLTTISYQQTIVPLLTKYCTSCHNASFKASNVDLSSYVEVVKHAENSLNAIQDGSMPPSGKLSELLIQDFTCWIKQGKLNN
jgi:hypothetical protein